MFDLTSSKLLILVIVAVVVVGPKDLPILLRTLGKYMGIIRRHANEFKAQIDEAIREAELDELKKTADSMSREIEQSIIEPMDRNVEFSSSRSVTPAVGEDTGTERPLPSSPASEPLLTDRREGSSS